MTDSKSQQEDVSALVSNAPGRKSRDLCGICRQSLDELEIGICQNCKQKGPPSWSQCSSERDFHVKMMIYRRYTDLLTNSQKFAAINEIDRELKRYTQLVNHLREAQQLLPQEVKDLTDATLLSVLLSLPIESIQKVKIAIENADAKG